MFHYILIISIYGAALGGDDWFKFETREDCMQAAQVAANVGARFSMDAYCYEWDGHRGDFVGGLAMGCSKGYAPFDGGGCHPVPW